MTRQARLAHDQRHKALLRVIRARMVAVGMCPRLYSEICDTGRVPLGEGLEELARRESKGATGLCPRCGSGRATSDGTRTRSGRVRLICSDCGRRFTRPAGSVAIAS